ncbi:MAG: C39 family peptidase [Chloroflexia bacterium]
MKTNPLRKLFLLSCSLLAMLVPALAIQQVAKAQEDAYIIEGIPSVTQWYSLSCEYAAAATVTLYWGNLVSQKDFIAEVPQHLNPHIGFRGDINGPFGWIEDYGIYAEPLVPVLERRGYKATVFYGTDVERLKANIRAGNPAVVWITWGRYEERPEYWDEAEGQKFKLVPYEHAVVLYGYDSAGVYSMDVGSGSFVHTEWDSFLRRWGYFDGLTLIIQPQ